MAEARRVVLVSADLMFQSQLAAALRASGGELVVVSRECALAAAGVDTVVVDLNADVPHRLGLIAQLRQPRPDLRIVAFCHHGEDETRRMAMRVGASSCITNGALQSVALRLAGQAQVPDRAAG